MPPRIAESDRVLLERAAESCPIKHSFDADIPVHVTYTYPAIAMA